MRRSPTSASTSAFSSPEERLYHAEPTQEDFLVLTGEMSPLVEGEERPLTAWDFVHCPPEPSTFVADIPCILIMAAAPRSSSAAALAGSALPPAQQRRDPKDHQLPPSSRQDQAEEGL